MISLTKDECEGLLELVMSCLEPGETLFGEREKLGLLCLLNMNAERIHQAKKQESMRKAKLPFEPSY